MDNVKLVNKEIYWLPHPRIWNHSEITKGVSTPLPGDTGVHDVHQGLS